MPKSRAAAKEEKFVAQLMSTFNQKNLDRLTGMCKSNPIPTNFTVTLAGSKSMTGLAKQAGKGKTQAWEIPASKTYTKQVAIAFWSWVMKNIFKEELSSEWWQTTAGAGKSKGADAVYYQVFLYITGCNLDSKPFSRNAADLVAGWHKTITALGRLSQIVALKVKLDWKHHGVYKIDQATKKLVHITSKKEAPLPKLVQDLLSWQIENNYCDAKAALKHAESGRKIKLAKCFDGGFEQIEKADFLASLKEHHSKFVGKSHRLGHLPANRRPTRTTRKIASPRRRRRRRPGSSSRRMRALAKRLPRRRRGRSLEIAPLRSAGVG